MKRIIIFLLCIVFVFCSCEGKRGPAGPAGPEGEDLGIEITTGILMACDLGSFWTFEFKKSLEERIITVDVRENKNGSWFEPFWFYDINIIYIGHNDLAKPGYEYRIAMAK